MKVVKLGVICLIRHNQFFYYGMLSSKFDIDSFAVDRLKRIRNSLKVPRLHAAELGVAKLDAIADRII